MTTITASLRPVLDLAERAAAATTRHVRLGLALIVVLQLVLVIGLFASVEHNRWLTYQGGDQLWLMTSAWLLAHGTIPIAVVSYGWPTLIAPLTWITGASSMDLLPYTTLFQVLVLGPVATLAVYDIGARVAGRVAGLWCALAVVVAPYLATPLFVDRYQERWTDQVLVQATGLTQMADYPSTVAALVAAALVLRSIQLHRMPEVVLAGSVAGLMIALKPANAIFVAGPVLAYGVARRWSAIGVFLVALAPAVLTLAIWKARGLGTLPLFAVDELRLAAGPALDRLPAGFSLTRSAPFHLEDWQRNMSNLREFFWSARLAQWAPIAGVFAVARVSRPAAALLAGWVAAYFAVKGSSFVAGIENASFWRLVMPALPAYVILVAATPLLVPTLPRRLGSYIEPVPVRRRASMRTSLAVAGALAAVPLAFVLAGSPQRGADDAVLLNDILIPVAPDTIAVSARAVDDTVVLRWTDTTSTTRPFYRVFRTSGQYGDVGCSRGGADRCTILMDELGVTRRKVFVDTDPVPNGIYRVGVAANWVDDPTQGDVFVISRPVPTP
jgi:hypothetical protein